MEQEEEQTFECRRCKSIVLESEMDDHRVLHIQTDLLSRESDPTKVTPPRKPGPASRSGRRER